MTLIKEMPSKKEAGQRISKRQVLLETALRLFNEHGYANVGVDRIVGEAKIAKPTLYTQFGTKNGLIEEVLKLRDDNFMESLQTYVAQAPDGAVSKVTAILEWHKKWFTEPNFFGCMFIKASEEFGKTNEQISAIVKKHKDSIYNLIHQAIEPDCKEKTDQIASIIMIILEGLIVNYNIYGDLKPYEVATTTVKELLHSISPRLNKDKK
ncbi:TetR/AcrR family transcriptional regulator [Bartonella sp. M0283]|uniref:TetR/AcrR family transcriptional regulator n=1 Tax=Bartonella sp. M0283 TaxID=2751016 RepID=UPI0018DD6F88|nr:TetR/AcrR family transcriptional regulator [Bartonella sp. M0283]MBI0162051.1 TetR/AcrR family transcriptional regulator [Bartonella sp. M0283]